MAVVSMMRIAGDADELAAKMREMREWMVPLAESHGALANIVARDRGGGLLVVNVWETEEGRHAMAQEPEVRAALEGAGIGPPAFEGYEIIDLNLTERIAAKASA
jgi:hypothetical protein